MQMPHVQTRLGSRRTTDDFKRLGHDLGDLKRNIPTHDPAALAALRSKVQTRQLKDHVHLSSLTLDDDAHRARMQACSHLV